MVRLPKYSATRKSGREGRALTTKIDDDSTRSKTVRLLIIGILGQIIYIIVSNIRRSQTVVAGMDSPQESFPIPQVTQGQDVVDLSQQILNETKGEDELLDILLSSYSEHGDVVSHESQSDRVETFGQYLKASKAVSRQWEKEKNHTNIGILVMVGRGLSCSDAIVTSMSMKEHALKRARVPIMIAHYGSFWCSKASIEYMSVISSTPECGGKCLQNVSMLNLKNLEYPKHHLPLAKLNTNAQGKEEWMESLPNGLLKSMALYKAPFRKVLMIDAGTIVLQNPLDLLRDEDSLNNGQVFWSSAPDRNPEYFDDGMGGMGMGEHEYFYGGEYVERQIDPSYMVIDRISQYDIVEWLLFVHSHHAHYAQYSPSTDLFRFAFSLADKSPVIDEQLIPSLVFGYADMPSEFPTKWGPHGITQPHPRTKTPLFMRDMSRNFETECTGLFNTSHITSPISNAASMNNVLNAPQMIKTKAQESMVQKIMNGELHMARMKGEIAEIEHGIWNDALDWTCTQKSNATEDCWDECLRRPYISCMSTHGLEYMEGYEYPTFMYEIPEESYIRQGVSTYRTFLSLLPFQE
jgi:hypothetical protein